MNDITALMATMKAAAEKATEAHERLSAMPSDGLFDASLAENAQLESDITALIAHNDASTPANVRVLVEALERAQHDSAVNWEAAASMNVENQELKQRIAELESRTVTVKSVPPEVRNALKAEGLADVLKDAEELTAGQWEALTRNRYYTFIRLSGAAAGIQVIEGGA